MMPKLLRLYLYVYYTHFVKHSLRDALISPKPHDKGKRAWQDVERSSALSHCADVPVPTVGTSCL